MSEINKQASIEKALREGYRKLVAKWDAEERDSDKMLADTADERDEWTQAFGIGIDEEQDECWCEKCELPADHPVIKYHDCRDFVGPDVDAEQVEDGN